MLGAMLTFLVSWIGLIGLLGRLGWDTGRLFARIRRHYVALIPIAACYLFLIFSGRIAPDAGSLHLANLRGMPENRCFRSVSARTPVSEEYIRPESHRVYQLPRSEEDRMAMMYADGQRGRPLNMSSVGTAYRNR